MNELNIQVALQSGLFDGISLEDLNTLLPTLRPRQAAFEKNEFILNAGDRVRSVGLLLSGAAHVLKEDFWGRRTILSGLRPGDIFAEVYALLPNVPLEVSVMATTPTEVLFLDAEQAAQPDADSVHARLAWNLLSILARKNLLLSRQAEILSKRTIRDRLMSYLSAESFHRGLTAFEIPFNRQELADHLSVDRSALSSEISRLKREGVIDSEHRTFVMRREPGEA